MRSWCYCSSTCSTADPHESFGRLLASTQIRAQRGILSLLPNALAADEKRRTIFDAKNLEPDPPQGTRVRGEEDPPSLRHI